MHLNCCSTRIGIYKLFVASFSHILLSLPDLTEYGVWTIIHSCLTSSALRSTALLSLETTVCRSRVLFLALRTRETLPRRPSLIERGNITCTSQLWGSLTTSRLAPFGSTVPSCLTYLEFALAGGRSTRFDLFAILLFLLTLLGNDQNVQCGGLVQIPGSPTLPLRIVIFLGTRPQCYARLSLDPHHKSASRSSCCI